jgi:hypothetical protein
MHMTRYRAGMTEPQSVRPEDENQDVEPPRLPYEVREDKIRRLTEFLQRLPAGLYKPLAVNSCGVIDPHHEKRRRAAEELARILIPG